MEHFAEASRALDAGPDQRGEGFQATVRGSGMDHGDVRFNRAPSERWSQDLRPKLGPAIGWVDNREPDASPVAALEVCERDRKRSRRVGDLCDSIEQQGLINGLLWVDQGHMRRNPRGHHRVPLTSKRL